MSHLSGLVFVACMLGTSPSCLPQGGTRRAQGAGTEGTAGKAKKLDFEAHVKALEKKLPSDAFHVVIQPPFVVIGDESLRDVKRWAKSTVKWASDLLKKEYFTKEIDHIIDVWLFKDKKSYEKHTLQVFGDEPTTPYGYYSPRHKALIMNIDTGGGTLVHEIVHPYVHVNFPTCPAWFNEGLGSLYEQCNERNKRIVGLTNWRLAGLQRAIRRGTVPSFRSLTKYTQHEFYTLDKGTNYAQARYLCYYLQEKGLLQKYYREFHKNQKKDPSGYATLKRILGRAEKDMPAFKKEWERYVLALRFER